MIYLSQNSLPWGPVKLGNTPLTVGRYGCTITCLSMLSDYFKDFKDPGFLAKNLKFTSDSLVIWGSLPAVLPYGLERRIYSRNDFEIRTSLKDPNKAVILNVNDGAHWVVALKETFLPGLKRPHYVVLDPWDGKKKTTRDFRNIVGSAHFIKK